MENKITIKGARVHNLKNIDVELPIDKLVVITGLSGSGKSSLAFDTIYAEGQRRYVESLSSYARQFLGVMGKPDVDSIKGLSPAVSIEQKSISHNPRSTVGTITEIYDYLRLLFARVGTPFCPLCGQEISSQDAQRITKKLLAEYENAEAEILAPLIRGKKGHYEKMFENLNKEGYVKVRVDGQVSEIVDYLGHDKKVLQRYAPHNIEVVIGSLKLESKNKSKLHRFIETSLNIAHGLVLVSIKDGKQLHNVGKSKVIEKIYSEHLACPDCDVSFDKLQPRMFSFNSPFGACPTCHGLGIIQKFDESLIIPDKTLTLAGGAIKPQGFAPHGFFGQTLEKLADKYGFNLNTPIEKMSRKHLDIILYGSDDKIDWRFDSSSSDTYWEWTGKWEGVVNRLERLYKKTSSESRRAEMEKFMMNKDCGACGGARLKQESLSVKIDNKNIFDLTEMPVKKLYQFNDNLKFDKNKTEIASPIIKEIKDRLQFLMDVGLDYLTLSRQGGTLSGGEAQRIRLATQIGSELRGVMYVLDEPSIGLHQRDNQKLIKTLKDMRDLGNSVIVVEHDEDTIMEADYVIDIGPGAGIHGGKVMAVGSPEEIKNNKKSLTGDYLSGRKTIPVPKKRRPARGWIKLKGASENNLKHVNVEFPVEVFTCVTGVSGSGKSTLVSNTLYPILAKRLNRAQIISGKYDEIENFGYIDKVIIHTVGEESDHDRYRPVSNRPHSSFQPRYLYWHLYPY